MSKDIVKQEFLKMVDELQTEKQLHSKYLDLPNRNIVHAQQIIVEELAKRLKINLKI